MRITVRVVPNAKKERIEAFASGLKVYVTAPALEGKANKRLLEVLAAYLKLKKSSLKIIKGESSRNKVVEVAGK
jgi:uncharacterized protein (TIGR00251 family)